MWTAVLSHLAFAAVNSIDCLQIPFVGSWRTKCIKVFQQAHRIERYLLRVHGISI